MVFFTCIPNYQIWCDKNVNKINKINKINNVFLFYFSPLHF